MTKRLHMTSADYLAIAVGPALIMALVGSLVFFLIEVFYAGQYQARLNYAFALFVFATVLIARIAIEMGSERASLFALALGGAMFMFLVRFVEHPSPFSHLINLALMAGVWWCAHKLTWDSTVIDDDEDASGVGLMQQIGVDGPEKDADKDSAEAAAGTRENELLADAEGTKSPATNWLKRLFRTRTGHHTPGKWVLYFSLAALPLFGIGQHWIPPDDVGRRHYAFSLLLVYVAAALALLVSTSFLNLRRYLRQRNVEMPMPIVGTWVGLGAALIAAVMLFSMMIPRPGAEVALSRVPWQAGSPSSLQASRTSVQRDGGEENADQPNATGGERETEKGQGNLPPNGEQSDGNKDPNSTKDAKAESDQAKTAASSNDKRQEKDSQNDASKAAQQKPKSEKSKSADNRNATKQSEKDQKASSQPKRAESAERSKTSPASKNLSDAMRSISQAVGGAFGVLKLIFYVVGGLVIAYLVWRNRQQIWQAISDILRALGELFGGRKTIDNGNAGEESLSRSRLPSFADYRDPFLTDEHRRQSPEELVRYTFAAFEAWARDRGRPRTPDCTPQELINLAVDPKTAMYEETRRLVRMYGELAYGSRRIPREATNALRTVWQLMQSTHSAGAIVAAQQ
jgi:hypothetical protein